MKLLKDIGMAIFNLKQYECEKSLQHFEQLPQSQIQSSFILSNMARAHFELHNYSKAEKLYSQLRREYPYHLEGLEYYSTTLSYSEAATPRSSVNFSAHWPDLTPCNSGGWLGAPGP